MSDRDMQKVQEGGAVPARRRDVSIFRGGSELTRASFRGGFVAGKLRKTSPGLGLGFIKRLTGKWVVTLRFSTWIKTE